MGNVAVSAWPIFKSKLVGSWRIADRTMAFRFERPAGWTFRAGQFIDITVLNPSETDAEGNGRGFSLTSAPDEDAQLIATRMRDTAFKRAFAAASPETEFQIQGLFGDFESHRDLHRTAVLIAGGIGITPFRSMALEALHRRSKPQILLFYFNLRPEDAPFLRNFNNWRSATRIMLSWQS
jgi:ferredoxin-NADP reductase